MRRSRKPIGFSMLEMMVTLAIVAVLLAIAVPSVNQAMKTGNNRREVRQLLNRLQRVRVRAMTGETVPGVGILKTGGLQLISKRSYRTFLSTTPNADPSVHALWLDTINIKDGLQLELRNPTDFPSLIRFRSDGTLVPSTMDRIEIKESGQGRIFQVTLTAIGKASVRDMSVL